MFNQLFSQYSYGFYSHSMAISQPSNFLTVNFLQTCTPQEAVNKKNTLTPHLAQYGLGFKGRKVLAIRPTRYSRHDDEEKDEWVYTCLRKI